MHPNKIFLNSVFHSYEILPSYLVCGAMNLEVVYLIDFVSLAGLKNHQQLVGNLK